MNRKYTSLFTLLMVLSTGLNCASQPKESLGSVRIETLRLQEELKQKEALYAKSYAPLLFRLSGMLVNIPAFIGTVGAITGAFWTTASIGIALSPDKTMDLMRGGSVYANILKDLYARVFSSQVSPIDIVTGTPRTVGWKQVEGLAKTQPEQIMTRFGIAAPFVLTGSFALWGISRYLFNKAASYQNEIDQLKKKIGANEKIIHILSKSSIPQ